MNTAPQKYVAFLRGINVGGHHKVPMAELRKEMDAIGFKNVVTILNTGNIIFEGPSESLANLENKISTHLESVFGFPIPTIIRSIEMIESMLANNPFEGITVTKEIRLYVSFLWKAPESDFPIPWTSDDKSFQILGIRDNTFLSVLDLSITKTPKAMEVLERNFGKDITTRNWNTIKRIEKKIL